MPSKSDLIQKLTAKRMPRNFTVRDLDAFSLMLRIPEKSSMRIRLKLLSSS